MKHADCPATALYQRLKEKFDKCMCRPQQVKSEECFIKRLTNRHLCPISYFKGKIAEKTYTRLENDASLQEDIQRGVVKHLSILFADIRGFTRRTANMPPERIVAMLDLFIPEMLNIIINRHGGMVDKLLGDGILALYGHPYQTGGEIVKAIHSAVDMQQAAAAMDHVLKLGGYDPIEIGIGINSGSVLICEVGDDRYRESTVIGAPVNIAAKMEDVAKAQEIALPVDVLDEIGKFKSSMLKYFETRGRINDVEVAVFDWVRYLQQEAHGVEDWKVLA